MVCDCPCLVRGMPRRLRIANFLMTLNNDYQVLQRDACRAAAKRHHLTLTELSARNNANQQLRQITECLAEPESLRPQALIVSPVAEGFLRPAAEQAARLGVGFVLLNRWCPYIEELRRGFPRVPIFTVIPDQHAIGRIQGQHFKKLLPNGGELLYITGLFHASSAQLRLAGVMRELADTDIEMVIRNGDWSIASGTWAVRDWLHKGCAPAPANCAVGAQNDRMAMGARAALVSAAIDLQQPGLANIPVTGCDGTPSGGQACVTTQELCATVVMPATADTAVNEVVRALESGQMPAAQISLDVTSFPALDLVTRPDPARPPPQSSVPRARATNRSSQRPHAR